MRVVSCGLVLVMVAWRLSISVFRLGARRFMFFICMRAPSLSLPMKFSTALLVSSNWRLVSFTASPSVLSLPPILMRPRSLLRSDDSRQRNLMSAFILPLILMPSCRGRACDKVVRSMVDCVWKLMSGSPSRSPIRASARMSVLAPLKWNILRSAYEGCCFIRSTWPVKSAVISSMP